MDTKGSGYLDKVLAQVGELPAMPEIVSDALRLMDDPTVEMNTISEVIEQDPALAAQILRLSNSAYYGLKRQVGTVKLALVVLGIRELRNIVLAASVYDVASGGRADSPVAYDLWRHSLMVAGLCKKLGTEMRLGREGEDFVAGLLHDIGKLVLWCRMRSAYEPLLREARDNQLPVHRLEFDRFGFTHADVAAVLGRRWALPESLVDALWLHHPKLDLDLQDTEDPCLAALVRVSNLAIKDTSAMEALEPEAWRVLESAPVAILPAQRVGIMIQFRGQLEQAPMPV